jgi:hypothetical protein
VFDADRVGVAAESIGGRGTATGSVDTAERSGASGFASATEPLPVLAALRPLVPGGGLRPGWVVGLDGPGSTSLGLALMAGVTAGEGWCAAVGLPDFGVVAAAEMGVDPERLLLVDRPGPRWPDVVAALAEVAELILVRPPERAGSVTRRRLAALGRRDRCALAVCGEWEGAQLRLRVAASEWIGIGAGHGHLRGRRARVVAGGRGAAGPHRSAWMWLPGADGTVTPAQAPAGSAQLPPAAPVRGRLIASSPVPASMRRGDGSARGAAERPLEAIA